MLTELRKTLKNQSEIEKLVIDARLDGNSISEMDEKELRITADKIIVTCSAYTGCELPITEFFAETLSEAILSFLKKMGYGDLTLNEILFAMEMNLNHQFRLPGSIDFQDVVFSGRCVNVSFISKVLANYMLIRVHLDRRFQNMIDGHE